MGSITGCRRELEKFFKIFHQTFKYCGHGGGDIFWDPVYWPHGRLDQDAGPQGQDHRQLQEGEVWTGQDGKYYCQEWYEQIQSSKGNNVLTSLSGLLKKSEGHAMTAATLYNGPQSPGNSCKIFIHNVSVLVIRKLNHQNYCSLLSPCPSSMSTPSSPT